MRRVRINVAIEIGVELLSIDARSPGQGARNVVREPHALRERHHFGSWDYSDDDLRTILKKFIIVA